MHVLAIVVGILLALFGGGCTLIMGGLVVAEPQSMIDDLGNLLSVVVPLGILPLVAGIFLIRWGIKKDRERRNADRKNPNG